MKDLIKPPFALCDGKIEDSQMTVLARLNIGDSVDNAKLIVEALNHYYSPAPIDVEGAAEEWAKGKLGVLTGLDTAIKSHTNATVNTMLIKAFHAGSRHGGQQWVRVEERMPKIGQHVLIHSLRGGIEDVYTDGEKFVRNAIIRENVTHWMPLPSSPKL